MIRLLHSADQIHNEVAAILSRAEQLEVVLWKLDATVEDQLWSQRERIKSLIVGVETPGVCDLFSGARVSRLERELWPGNLILARRQGVVEALMGNWGHGGIPQAYVLEGDSQSADILKIEETLLKHREESRVAAGSPASGNFHTTAAPLELVGIDELRQLLSEESYRSPLSWLHRDLRRAGSAHKISVPGTAIREVLVASGGTLSCTLVADGGGRWLCYFSSECPQGDCWMPTCTLKLGPQENCELTLGIESDRTFLLFRGRGGRFHDFGKLAGMPTTAMITSNASQPVKAVIVAELGRPDLMRRLTDFVVQWEQDNPMPSRTVAKEPPSEVVLEGELNEGHLENAINEVKPGGTIRLTQTTIRLGKPLNIGKPLIIKGEEPGSSRLLRQDFNQDSTITFTGEGPWTLADLTLEGCPVVIERGLISIRGCKFADCKRTAGLLVRGSAQGRVEDCRATGNLVGIAVGGSSAVALERNQCERNQDGICFQDDACGSALANECKENRLFGIKVTDRSQATVQDNLCRKNRDSGIGYSCTAGGTAKGNRCQENYLSGVSAKGQADPTLENNQCSKNGKHGIAFAGEATGTARNNHCCENDSDGISLSDKAAPTLEANSCQHNADDGISYYDDSGGSALSNDCAHNGWAGISAHNRARPTLERNHCEENGSHSITFSGAATGTVRGNLCGSSDIWIGEQARPIVENDPPPPAQVVAEATGVESTELLPSQSSATQDNADQSICKAELERNRFPSSVNESPEPGNEEKRLTLFKESMLVFFNTGRMVHIKAGDRLPESDNEHMVAAVPASKLDLPGKIITCTRHGLVKRSELDKLRIGESTCALNLYPGDELVGVRVSDGDQTVFLVTRDGQAIRFPEHEAPVSSLNALGVWGIQLQPGDFVVAMTTTWSQAIHLLVVSQNGYVKQTPLCDYPIHGRRGKGVPTLKITDKTGPVAGALVVSAEMNEILLASVLGKQCSILRGRVPVAGRITQGQCLFPLGPGDKVISVRAAREWRFQDPDVDNEEDEDDDDSVEFVDDEPEDAPGLDAIDLLEEDVSSVDLLQALRRLRSGGTLRLGKCVIRLPKGLVITKSFTLLGQGPKLTRILCDNPEDAVAALQLSGEGPWNLEDLSIGYELWRESLPKDHQNYCVRVEDGQIEFTRCQFHGAAWAALVLEGSTRGQVADCDIQDSFYGIQVDGDVSVCFEKNRVHSNDGPGLMLAGKASSVVCNCEFRDNGAEGILIQDEACPRVEGNHCHRNGSCGITVANKATGTFVRNVCSENGTDGISLTQESQGQATGNECHLNARSGISLFKRAKATLEDNRCSDNGLHGISFADTTCGTAKANRCWKNRSDAIVVAPKATAIVEPNQDREPDAPAVLATPATPSGSFFSPLTSGLQVPPKVKRENLDDSVELVKDEPAEVPGLQSIELLERDVSSADLVAALRRLRSGGTLRLGRGVIRLPKGLVIHKALTLQGESAEHTRIVCESQVFDAAAFHLKGRGPWTLTGLAIGFDFPSNTLSEKHDNYAMRVDSGRVEISKCRFHGAAHAGLLVGGNTCGRVSLCAAVDNYYGIRVGGNSTVVLEANRVYRNQDAGVFVAGAATCVVRNNQCLENGGEGLWIEGTARPTLESNRCLGNELCGITFAGESGGSARKNECCENKHDGISVSGSAEPRLEENFCLQNEYAGLHFEDESRGVAVNNQCRDNGQSGINVVEQAKPTLEANLCQKCKLSGITFSDESKGVAVRNECQENGHHGIQVDSQAKVTLDRNRCVKNARSGICFDQSASGLVKSNTCKENVLSGFQAQGQSSPCLEKNQCINNGRHGISFRGKASGAVRDNICNENEVRSIWVGRQAQATQESNLCIDRIFDIDPGQMAKIRGRLLEKGKSQGSLFHDDILDAFSPIRVSDEQIQEILAGFAQAGITVVDEADCPA